MSKPEAINAITKLIQQLKKGGTNKDERKKVIELAIKEGVMETLLDKLQDHIDTLRPSKPC